MCLENPTSSTNNGKNNQSTQQKGCLSTHEGTFHPLRATTNANSTLNQEPNESSKLKYSVTKAMEEKRKRLPPGYVNVSTKSLSDVNCDDETKKSGIVVSYVNTECVQNTDLLIPNESQSSLDLLGVDTKILKFGLDPIKQEIPFNDSHPSLLSIAPPPRKQKLSPQKTSVNSQSNSGEFHTNSQCINNEISRTSAVINNDEIIREDETPISRSWYGRSKSSSFSSSSVIDGDCTQWIEEVKENISWSDPNIEKRSNPSFSATTSHHLKYEDNISSSIGASDDQFFSPHPNKPTASRGIVLFDTVDSNQSPRHVRPNSFGISSLESAYQNTDASAILKENNLHGNTIMPDIKRSSSAFFPLSTQHSNNINSLTSHPRQYIHSAGGGCVSPISDSAPQVLITSQNHFPYDHSEKFGVPNQRFSQTNPFLPLLEKERENSQTNSKNPFLWIASDEKDNKSQVEIRAVPELATSGRFPYQERQSPIQVSNTVNVNFNNTSPPANPIHIHHHHHHYNQSNNESSIEQNQIVHNHSTRNSYPEAQSISFTPPPSIDFPSSHQTRDELNAASPSIFSYGGTNENMRLVLKPKKEPLSYKDLEHILLRNKNLLSKCGWYYGKMKADESTTLLSDTVPGTFLVRDSSDPKYWFSLSMQRGNNVGGAGNKENTGPTSIRIHFVNGKFQLDAEDRIRNIMPEFDTIIDLIQYYVSTSLNELKKVEEANSTIDKTKSFQNAKSQTLWVDSSGKLYQTIFLAYPLYKKDQTQSLSHMCRLTINSSIVSKITNEFTGNIYSRNQYLDSITKLDLPVRIQSFLEEYPNII